MNEPVKHGRANHDPQSAAPECLCGAKGVKDPMWDRYYCPTNGVWLEGLWAQCWCPVCLATPIKTEEEKCIDKPVNSWQDEQ